MFLLKNSTEKKNFVEKLHLWKNDVVVAECLTVFFKIIEIILFKISKIILRKLNMWKNNLFLAEFPTAVQNNRDKLDRGSRLYWGVNQSILSELDLNSVFINGDL